MQPANKRQRSTPAEDSRRLLPTLLSSRSILVGVGNTLRGDDGAGPALIDTLRDRCSCICIDAGAVPENYLGQILRHEPRIIVFIDAVDMQLAPGEWRVFEARELAGCGFHTHSIPLGQLLAFLGAQSPARAYILGIQPRRVALGEPLSPEVSDSLHEIERIASAQCHGDDSVSASGNPAADSAHAGNSIRNTLPTPGALSNSTRPPCKSTTRLTIDNPKPLPGEFRV